VKRDKEESDQKMDLHGLVGGNVFSKNINNEIDILSILYLPVAAVRCPGPDPLPLAFVWSW